jgi:hypothetical protein
MPYAKIVNGSVVQVLPVLEGALHPSLHSQYTEVSGEVVKGMATEDGTSFTWPAVEDLSLVEELEPETVYRPLTKLDALGLFRAITGMDDAGEMTMRKDPNLELLWMKWATDVPQSINRDNPVVGMFLDGLIATGHATEAHKTAMLEAWPVE